MHRQTLGLREEEVVAMRRNHRMLRSAEVGVVGVLVAASLGLLGVPPGLAALTRWGDDRTPASVGETQETAVADFDCGPTVVTASVDARADPVQVDDGETVALSLQVHLSAAGAIPAARRLLLTFPVPAEVTTVADVAFSDQAGLTRAAWFSDQGALTLVLVPGGGSVPISVTAAASLQVGTGVAPATMHVVGPTALTLVAPSGASADVACTLTGDPPALVDVVVAQATTPTTAPPSTTTTSTTSSTSTTSTTSTTVVTPQDPDPASGGDAPAEPPVPVSDIPHLPPPPDPAQASRLVTADLYGAQSMVDSARDELASTSAQLDSLEREAAAQRRRERRLEAERSRLAARIERLGHRVDLLAAEAYVSAVDAYVSLAETSGDAVVMGTALEQGLAGYQQVLDRQAEVVAQLGEVAGTRARGQSHLDEARAEREALQAQVADSQLQISTAELGGKVIVTGFHFPVDGRHDFTDTWHAPRSGGRLHQGTDIFAAEGTPLVAVERGVLARVGQDTLGGTKLWLVGESGTQYYYAHLSAYAPGVADGTVVDAGQVIGYVGHTGNAATTPSHLHFEVHPGGGDAVDGFPLLSAADGVPAPSTTTTDLAPASSDQAPAPPSPGASPAPDPMPAAPAPTSSTTTSPPSTTTTATAPAAAGEPAVGTVPAPSVALDRRPRVERGWGQQQDLADWLEGPTAVVAAADGSAYVADTGHDRVQHLDADGRVLAEWGSTGSGDGQLHGPRSVAVSPDGTVFVADTGNNRVQHFTADGDYLGQWGGTGERAGRFNEPTGVAVDDHGRVFVADTLNNRIQVFDDLGTRLGSWGEFGGEPGQFANPTGVTVGPDGDLYVADTFNGRIQRLTRQGRPVSQWTEGLRRPYAVAVSASGGLIVADRSGRAIRQYDADGHLLEAWGRRGAGDGHLRRPSGLALDADGRLLVADTGNDRLQRFGWP